MLVKLTLGERENEEAGEITKAAILTLLHPDVVGICLRGEEGKVDLTYL